MKLTKFKMKNKNLEGIEFSLGKEKRLFDYKTLKEVKEHIDQYISFLDNVIPYIKYYKDFEKQIDSLIGDKKAKNDEGEYSIGENFALFTGHSRGEFRIADNDKACDYIKKLYKKRYGKNTLLFDPESSYCYVYTKNKKEAKRFLLFTYKEIIKPWINDLKQE